MTQLTSLTVRRGRVRRNELGGAWICATTDLASPGLLTSASGRTGCLAVWRPDVQTAGGQEAFATALADDGTLSVVLVAGPPPGAAGAPDASGGEVMTDNTSFALIVESEAGRMRHALQATWKGAQVQLSVRLGGDDLQRARAALYDLNPRVVVEVSQSVDLAARQTDDFIRTHWSNKTIQAGLLEAFGGIPIDSAATYVELARGGDPDFPNQFLVMGCTLVSEVGVPSLPTYVQWQVSWQDRAYHYYQDARRPSRVFYLPDQFELAAGDEGAPTLSLLQFTLPPGGSSVTGARAAFHCFGAAVVDRSRIDHAGQVLAEKMGLPPEMTSLEDAHDVHKAFFLYLPGPTGSDAAPVLQEQREASIDLREGLRNGLNLSFDQFRALWAAIFSRAPEKTLFRGQVDVVLLNGRYREEIAFVGRLPMETREDFLNQILDRSTTQTYPVQLSVRAHERIFQPSAGAEADPRAAVREVSLLFDSQPRAAVTLTADRPQMEVSLERSILDILLGIQPPDQHPFRLTVLRQDGTKQSCRQMADSAEPDLWIMPAAIAQCVTEPITPPHP